MLLVTIENLVTGLAGYAKLPAYAGHGLPVGRATKRRRSSITELAPHAIHTPPKKAESVTHVLEEFSRPGAGFAISERDLDLRGAGDLFSERQSGHVQVFGPVLYSHLLKLASEKIHDRAADLWVPDLNLPLADMLPTNYVPSETVRLEICGRVARRRSEADLEDLEEETARRFGKLPPAVCDFFAAAKLRLDCKRRGLVRLDVGPEAVAATFLPGRLRKSKSKSLERDGDRVVYAGDGHEKPFERVEEFLQILDE